MKYRMVISGTSSKVLIPGKEEKIASEVITSLLGVAEALARR